MLLLKSILFSNWTFTRFFRLAIGIMILIQGYVYHQIETIVMGYFFTGFALFTTGYCGFGGCSIPANNESKNDSSRPELNAINSDKTINSSAVIPVQFEEISTKKEAN